MTGDEGGADPSRVRHLVVMGVSGSGKTVVARGIASVTGFVFGEADEFHSVANVEKMRAGTPLDDEDRWPWLEALAAWMREHEKAGRSTVLACSALKRSYRDLLTAGSPGVEFAHLRADHDVILERMAKRRGHYMPKELLDSQFNVLEPLGPDEPGVTVDGQRPVRDIVDDLVDRLALPLI